MRKRLTKQSQTARLRPKAAAAGPSGVSGAEGGGDDDDGGGASSESVS
jgi:hypothetical protein